MMMMVPLIGQDGYHSYLEIEVTEVVHSVTEAVLQFFRCRQHCIN